MQGLSPFANAQLLLDIKLTVQLIQDMSTLHIINGVEIVLLDIKREIQDISDVIFLRESMFDLRIFFCNFVFRLLHLSLKFVNAGFNSGSNELWTSIKATLNQGSLFFLW